MAAQDFRYCSQSEGESTSSDIWKEYFDWLMGVMECWPKYETPLFHGQLQEGLQHRLMEAPAVSGTSTYAMLCQAAKTEEQRQAKLKKQRQYQSDRTDRPPASQLLTSHSNRPISRV